MESPATALVVKYAFDEYLELANVAIAMRGLLDFVMTQALNR